MRRSLLHVAKRDTGVEGGGDERVTQGVGSGGFVDPGTAGEAPGDPPGGVSVESFAVASEEDRSLGALADGQVDRPGWCAARVGW